MCVCVCVLVHIFECFDENSNIQCHFSFYKYCRVFLFVTYKNFHLYFCKSEFILSYEKWPGTLLSVSSSNISFCNAICQLYELSYSALAMGEIVLQLFFFKVGFGQNIIFVISHLFVSKLFSLAIADLSNMYILLKPIRNGLNYLIEKVENYIRQTGLEAVQDLKGDNVSCFYFYFNNHCFLLYMHK